MRDLILLTVLAVIIFNGFKAPFVMLLGYVWVDIFSPQTLAYGPLSRVPLSLVMACLTIFVNLRATEKSKISVLSDARPWMLLAFALWITLTTFWAEFPTDAWLKWNWAFKSILFCLLVPYSIKNRVQFESFILVIIFSLAGDAVTRGVKTAVHGGGYGLDLGLHHGNAGIAEGATFALAAISIIPLLAYLYRNGRLFSGWYARPAIVFGIALCLIGALGTFERTALVAVVVLALLSAYTMKMRPWLLLVIVALIGGSYLMLPSFMGIAWSSRMQTLFDFQELSSMGRLVVWKWTIAYANSHPWGVDSTSISGMEFDTILGEPKAFHSIWFEVLGEQGWIGLSGFLLLIGASLWSLGHVARAAKANPNLSWLGGLATALFCTIIIYCVSGSFVGIAYQPLLWYYLMLSVALSLYLRRVQAGEVICLAPPPPNPVRPRWATVGAVPGAPPRLPSAPKPKEWQPVWARHGRWR